MPFARFAREILRKTGLKPENCNAEGVKGRVSGRTCHAEGVNGPPRAILTIFHLRGPLRLVSDPKTVSRQGRQDAKGLLSCRTLLGALGAFAWELLRKTGRIAVLKAFWAFGAVVGRPCTGGGPLRLVFWARKPPFQPENRKI